jgi:hypothetical protein
MFAIEVQLAVRAAAAAPFFGLLTDPLRTAD